MPLICSPGVGFEGMSCVLVTSPVFGSVDVSTRPFVTCTEMTVVAPLRWQVVTIWGITRGPGPALFTVDRLMTVPLPEVLPWAIAVSDPEFS